MDGSVRKEATRPRLIAVVTVCRNPGAALRRTVESVVQLGEPRIRFIVVDGASNDGTVEYLRALDHSFCRWTSAPDGGIYDAMNHGWAMAPEEGYVLFLGAGDELLSLPSDEELFQAEQAFHKIVFGRTNTRVGWFRSRYSLELRLRNTLHHQSLMIRKDAHPSPPFNTSFRVYADWDFNLRLWRSGLTACRIESLRARAAAEGASAVPPLQETFLIASEGSGRLVGFLAWAIAARSRARPAVTGILRRVRRLSDAAAKA